MAQVPKKMARCSWQLKRRWADLKDAEDDENEAEQKVTEDIWIDEASDLPTSSTRARTRRSRRRSAPGAFA